MVLVRSPKQQQQQQQQPGGIAMSLLSDTSS